jgi:hypothetical protein
MEVGEAPPEPWDKHAALHFDSIARHGSGGASPSTDRFVLPTFAPYRERPLAITDNT